MITRQRLIAHARSEGGRRAMRYTGASVVGVIGTQILILVFYQGIELSEVWSNFVSTSLMSIPVFLLNKYWVWAKRGRAHIRREVLPFWLFTVAGWGLSTLAVALVRNAAPPQSTEQTVLVMGASIAGFGILWVLKYLFLDRIMFGSHHHTPYDEDIEAVEVAAAAGGVPEDPVVSPDPSLGAPTDS